MIEEILEWGGAAKNFSELLKDNIGIVTEPLKVVTKGVAERYNRRKDFELTKELEKLELKDRAEKRLLLEQLRKQSNLESIASKSLNLINETANVEELDIDWLHFFSDSCQNVGEPKLQDIWAKILAGEVNDKNSVSRRTLNLLKTFDKRDCEIFEKISSILLEFTTDVKFIYSNELLGFDYLEKFGIQYIDLKHLESLGLLTLSVMNVPFKSNEIKQLINKDEKFLILNESSQEYYLSGVMLTLHGLEILKVIKSAKNDKFLDFLKEELSQKYKNPLQPNFGRVKSDIKVYLIERIKKEEEIKEVMEIILKYKK